MTDVTQILKAVEEGDRHAADELLPLVYDELRRLAGQRMNAEQTGQTLQPTALVHEAYMRLVKDETDSAGAERKWDGRHHFFSAAAEAMRRILVENARRKKRTKHGGDYRRVDLQEHDRLARPREDEILALDEALTRLSSEDPIAAKVVQLHFFGGLSIELVGESLGISRATAYRQWAYARAWLRNAIGDFEEPL